MGDQGKQCCRVGRYATVFAHAQMASQAKLLSIIKRNGQSMHESQVFPTPTPLCKVHYHMVYNESQPVSHVDLTYESLLYVHALTPSAFKNI